MDASQWRQETLTSTSLKITRKKGKPHKDLGLNCPRCSSTNTKFCYFNNYSLTQPRYFCKTCRRYWTEGGSLRNIPVGGGSRKNKRVPTSSKKISVVDSTAKNPRISVEQDLNLTFPANRTVGSIPDLIQLPSSKTHSPTILATTSSQYSTLERYTGITQRGLNSFKTMPAYGSSFALDDLKPNLSFSVDALGSGYDNIHGVHHTSREMTIFPLDDMKGYVMDSTDNIVLNKDSITYTSGYWTDMRGRRSW